MTTWKEIKQLQIMTNRDAMDSARAAGLTSITAWRVLSLEPKMKDSGMGVTVPVHGKTEWVEWGDRTFYDYDIALLQRDYDLEHSSKKEIKIIETQVHIF